MAVIEYIKAWNRWRKGSLNSTLHKICVLLRLIKSPTFEQLRVIWRDGGRIMNTQEIDRIQCAIRHIQTSVDIDPWAMEIAVEAMEKQVEALKNSQTQMSGTSDLIIRQKAIYTDGLDEEIRCEMCTNQMRSDRGCDGNCRYDEKLYDKITQLINRRITQLPSAQPGPLSDAYTKAVWTWLLEYQIKAAELKGRYTPYEVLSWVTNDWRKEHEQSN